MATSQTSEVQADPSEVKRKLAWRMGFAGLMIIGLLGGLALFDRLSTQSDSEPSAPQFTEPVPVAKKLLTQPVTPAEPTPEIAQEAPAAAPESSAPPLDRSAPRAERPPRPEVAAQPTLPRATQPSGRPATSQAKAATSVSSTRGETPVAVVHAPPAPPRLFSGYALQAGVFSDPRRAEELHAKLTLEGIPSTIEARVQVGPFKSRAEAEAVREKMKTMGIDAVMLPPQGVKR
jgi:cell division septation protein DedD